MATSPAPIPINREQEEVSSAAHAHTFLLPRHQAPPPPLQQPIHHSRGVMPPSLLSPPSFSSARLRLCVAPPLCTATPTLCLLPSGHLHPTPTSRALPHQGADPREVKIKEKKKNWPTDMWVLYVRQCKGKRKWVLTNGSDVKF